MEKGDRVKIIDGSYAVRIDQHERYNTIGLTKDVFEILYSTTDAIKSGRYSVHDVVIRNTNNDRIYLHSKAFIRVVEPRVKEITISELESQYGCKVKIIK
jgi:hypothetical protein